MLYIYIYKIHIIQILANKMSSSVRLWQLKTMILPMDTNSKASDVYG